MDTCEIKINGMGCKKCVAKVEGALKDVKGIKKAKVSLDNKNAILKVDETFNKQEAVDAIVSVGFEAE